jgi:hypothetical protein
VGGGEGEGGGATVSVARPEGVKEEEAEAEGEGSDALGRAEAHGRLLERRLLEVVPEHPLPVTEASLGAPVGKLSKLALAAAQTLHIMVMHSRGVFILPRLIRLNQ